MKKSGSNTPKETPEEELKRLRKDTALSFKNALNFQSA